MSRESVEAEIETAGRAGDYAKAATLSLETYGDELLSFLTARLRDQADGQEVFSLLVEDLWTGLPKFEFRSSMRTWLYVLARNAASRYATAPSRRRERPFSFSQEPNMSALVERLRTRTEVHQRSEVRDRMRALRERLSPEDQTLLILRVDRKLSWRELAEIMSEHGSGAVDLEREASRLRKRFERLKAELKQWAKDEGLLRES